MNKVVHFTDFQAIFWDFDGVIMDSNRVREDGFRIVLRGYPDAEVDRLIAYHRINGGLSRYVKFRHFFEFIRGEEICEKGVSDWAERFSEVMKDSLVNPKMLISETMEVIRKYYNSLPMYVVSGSDQEELRYLMEQMGIHIYFKRIHGSPIPKKEWVKLLLEEEKLEPENVILIGDSINDWEAAQTNGLHFYGYNGSEEVMALTTCSLHYQ